MSFGIFSDYMYFDIQKNLCITKRPLSSKRSKMVFKTYYGLMQIKSIAECPKGSILQYFRPSLSYQLSLRPWFCLFLSGCFTQVLLHRLIVGLTIMLNFDYHDTFTYNNTTIQGLTSCCITTVSLTINLDKYCGFT